MDSNMRRTILPAEKSYYRYITPKGWGYIHSGESNQWKSLGGFEKPARPVFNF